MEGLVALVICLFLSLAEAQSVTLGGSVTVTEGTDAVFSVECSLGTPPATDTTVALVLDTTSTAENGYDFPDIAGYTCTIPATMNTGTINIPLTDDVVIETTNEEIALSASSMAANTYTVTIVDDDAGGTKLVATPRRTLYYVEEGTTLSIFFDFLDANGNPAPIEDTLTIDVVTPRIDSAEVANDYTVSASETFSASAMGIPTVSGTVQIVFVDDQAWENLESVEFHFTDMTAVDSITFTSTVEVRIQDDDKGEFVVVNNMTPVGRRFKDDLFLWAFVNDPTTITTAISYSWLPNNLKEREDSTITVGGKDVLQVRLPRPNRNSKSRFNEYRFSTVQTINAQDFQWVAYTYFTPTSHVKRYAPIETGESPTITVFPNSASCTALDHTYDITIPVRIKNLQLRWDFIPEGGSKVRRRRMKRYNGANQVRLSKCNVAGLYIVYRRQRRQRGWEEYVRVILAACPAETAGAGCATTDVICNNGGYVDPESELCACPPGFAGQACEIALDPGIFGSNAEFNIEDFTGIDRFGRCVMFSFHGPLGVTCGAGWTGNKCCDPCRSGYFGANCALSCRSRCMDNQCNRFSGECTNKILAEP